MKRSFVIGDMRFMSYQICAENALENAGPFIKEADCEAVNLEGESEVAPIVRAIEKAGIPVCGHIGLIPQTATILGGFKVQGKDADVAAKLLTSARDLEKAGVFMLLLECIPDLLAHRITQQVRIPTIGVGAGPHCDGQGLVFHDLVGLFDRFTPKFAKQYVLLSPLIKKALTGFRKEFEDGAFPGPEHTFSLPKQEAAHRMNQS